MAPMNRVADTLFSLFEDMKFHEPALFINARPHPRISGDMVLQQAFKPWALELEAAGHKSVPLVPVGVYETVFVLLSKNVIEAKYDVAKALSVLTEGGTLAIAASNDANGKRVEKILEEMGLDKIRDASGNKARAACGRKQGMTSEARGILQQGTMQRVAGEGFFSQPGLFSWDRPDKGSEILVHELPDDLAGNGADFGCGYGYLAMHVLHRCKNIEKFACVDADYRALEACKLNLKDIEIPVQFLWEDMTKGVPSLRNLDFVIMNPPFHEGKKTDFDVGREFIRRAAETLKAGGEFWAVANKQLPYERQVAEFFSRYEKFSEGGGYKVLRAVK
jgi:16S rRNA (guanine1207-N2)-methyltransferase